MAARSTGVGFVVIAHPSRRAPAPGIPVDIQATQESSPPNPSLRAERESHVARGKDGSGCAYIAHRIPRASTRFQRAPTSASRETKRPGVGARGRVATSAAEKNIPGKARGGADATASGLGRGWMPQVAFDQLGGVARDVGAERVVGHAVAVVERDQASGTQLHHMVLGGGLGEAETLG